MMRAATHEADREPKRWPPSAPPFKEQLTSSETLLKRAPLVSNVNRLELSGNKTPRSVDRLLY